MQSRFVNWFIGGDLIPVGNAGRCPVTWHLVDGPETPEKTNVLVTYCADETGEPAHRNVYAQVKYDELDDFLGLVVDYAPLCENGPLSAKAIEHGLGIGLMVKEIHVVLFVDMKKRISVWPSLRITQLPESDEIGEWLKLASHIVLFDREPSRAFATFDRHDSVPRHRVIVGEYTKGGIISYALGCGSRWKYSTIALTPMVEVGPVERRWLKHGATIVRDEMFMHSATLSVPKVETRSEVRALLSMDM
jgi:hypothetical protein